MLQLFQNLRDGSLRTSDIPCPSAGPQSVLIRTRVTLISAGTERMLLEFGKANWIGKARQQPDKVRMVIEKMRSDGVVATLESVRVKLDQPIPLGYSNVGVVLEVGSGAGSYSPADRVISNGSHAEAVRAPGNLIARIPEGVSDDAAAFTVVGAIALEGIRLAQPTLGETFVVTGLGLIGLLAVQLLRANGCRVLGIDLDPRKAELARSFGAETAVLSNGEDPVAAASRLTAGRGVDGVLITAATKSNEPLHQAALMCRKRGRIVLVGVTGLELSRDDFYKKELSFQVSCSYGPGRYDPAYEEAGQDYPFGFVRWTAQRNFEAVLQMMADGRLQVAPLITHRFPFDRAIEAYELMHGDSFYLGILLDYPCEPGNAQVLNRTILSSGAGAQIPAKANIGFIGAGAYACRVLLPAFRKAGAGMRTIASSGGASASHASRTFGFAQATTDVARLIEDEQTDTIVIATRHDTHAGLVCRALKAGKNVFVEKPLAIRPEELEEIRATRASMPAPVLMVGFNRRFAPHIAKVTQLLSGIHEPKSMVMTVNAGAVPRDHWTLEPEIGGGRIIGEACHFVDLLRHLTGASIASLNATKLNAETMTISLSFADGSVGAIHYFANGNKSFPKERLEVFCGGRILQLDNFRKLTGYGWPNFRKMNLWRQDKGQRAAVAAFVDAVRTGKPSPIPFDELIEVTGVTLAVSR
ncbi:MAG: bi-domain-containing oxidoreductase [Bryobacteraceae bacterium]|jgi:predicted dehydrogenase/threonine dehydrogenase-like Zn-dependent dehydrogenase